MESTSGVILERAEQNQDCCLLSSITTSEDGQSQRWPNVNQWSWPDKEETCIGGIRLTFQQWVDDYVSDFDTYRGGLCVEGWKYIVKGTLKAYQ